MREHSLQKLFSERTGLGACYTTGSISITLDVLLFYAIICHTIHKYLVSKESWSEVG